MKHSSARSAQFILWVVSLFLTASLSAKTIYISQSGAGSLNGTSAANAYAVTWLNTSSNWGSGTAQINPGDTIMLEGMITTPITIAASGTAGNVTTLKFDTGAYMTAPYWPNGGTSYTGWGTAYRQAAIMAGNLSYFVIDGGTNGYIECTDNGYGKTTQWDCVGIYMQSPQNVTVQNLTIKNLYVRTAHAEATSTGIGGGSMAISAPCYDQKTPTINFRVTNCVLHDVATGVYIMPTGASSGIEIDHCTIYNVNFGTGGGLWPSGSTLSGSSFHHNNVYGFSAWDDSSSYIAFHHDGIFWWAQSGSSSVITGTKIYNNKFGPDLGTTMTSCVFEQGYFTNELIYNNIFYGGTSSPGNSYVGISPYVGNCSARIINNTFVGNGQGLAINLTSTGTGNTYYVYNNLISSVAYGVGVFNNSGITLNCDYNLYYNLSQRQGSSSSTSSSIDLTWAAWQTLGYDLHGFPNSNPNLTATYALNYGSPAIDVGTSQATYFTTDYIGTIRASQGTAWDIGAYEYINTTPVITSAVTATAAVGSSFTYSITASNTPTAYAASLLPAGLSVNTSTGVISGTPTTVGTTNVTISATNASGTGTATLAITVAVPPSNAKTTTSVTSL